MPTPLRNATIRLAHTNPALRPLLLPLLKAAGLRLRDLDNRWMHGDESDLTDGFRRLTKVWSSESDAERALHRHLANFGLKVYKVQNLPAQRDAEWQQWSLSTEDNEVVEDHLNVFYRPGPRPGWVAFQVSM